MRSIAAAALTVAGLGVPAAAFLAGGGQQEPGPSVTPAVDMFMTQHEISTGNAQVSPSPSPSVSGVSRPAGVIHHRVAEPATAW